MKRTSTLLTVLVVLLAGCTGAVTNAAQTAGTDDSAEPNTVTATGSASVDAAPDVAVVHVSVAATADSAAAARSQVAADVESLRAALSEAGYELETTSYHLGPQYEHGPDGRQQVGYRAVHSFTFETPPDAAGEAVDLAVDNGATAVDGVQFGLSDERRAELRQQALTQAVGDARTDAETVAAAANRSVGTEVSMQVGSTGYSPYDVRYATEAADAASTSFEPGPVSVTATVTVTYELE